uniref:Uncharacterized protein n=1 Tax=Junco hyemalis TaxID=40217 RepID=A0A8C5ILC0_JUNHY
MNEIVETVSILDLNWLEGDHDKKLKLFLTNNYIRKVISFPLLEHLWLLEIGTQLVHPVTIGKRAFWNLPNLCILDLGDNKILQLHLDAFMGLPNLTVLHLFHNSLCNSILEECYFQDLRSLEELHLSTNEITKLHPYPLFYNLAALKSVNLKFNKISNFFQTNLTSFQGKHSLFFNISLICTRQLISHLCWKQMGELLSQRQLRNVELVRPSSRKFYCKWSTKGSKRIFGEHATEPFLTV